VSKYLDTFPEVDEWLRQRAARQVALKARLALGIKLKPGRRKQPAPAFVETVQVKVASSFIEVAAKQEEVALSVACVRRRTATIYDAVLEDDA
jgi:hypothetical protein